MNLYTFITGLWVDVRVLIICALMMVGCKSSQNYTVTIDSPSADICDMPLGSEIVIRDVTMYRVPNGWLAKEPWREGIAFVPEHNFCKQEGGSM